jgi:DNA invertase Pin-like site-specific DNA recombinase
MKTLVFVRGTNAKQQITACEEYAKANGLEIVGTAKTERELNKFVLGGGVECVIVSNATRISRSRIEYRETEKMFNRFGVKLIAAEGAAL